MHKVICLTAVLTAVAVCSSAQDVRPSDARFSDAVLDSAGTLYAAACDRAEVWKIDAATGDVVARASVGKSPAALALSADGATLACVNNLGHSVTLLHMAGFTPFATIDCPKGPSAIAALADGRFAVASPFEGKIVLINPETPSEMAVLQGDATVPVAVAADEGTLAVAANVPPSLTFYALPTATTPRTVALNAVPTAIAALGNGRFAVALPAGLAVFDAATGEQVQQADITATRLCAQADGLWALSERAACLLDASLAPARQISFEFSASGCAVAGGTLVALSPKSRQYALYGADGTPAPTQAVSMADAAPVAPAPEPAPVVAAQVDEKTDAPVVAVAAPAAPEEKADTKPKTLSHYRQMPLTMPDAHAPILHRKPSPIPFEDFGRRKRMGEGLSGNLDISPENGFKEPDWTQPLRDATADVWEREFGKNDVTLEGNVRLHLDTLDFAADKFIYSETAGEMTAEGNVVITQDQSSLKAGKVHYKLPDLTQIEERQSPLLPPMTEQERAKLRLSSGIVEAHDVHIVQPTQELYADALMYDAAASTGCITNARGHAGMYYFAADEIRILGPASMDGEDVWVTTCDHNPPHYKIRMGKASIRDGKAVYATSARLQLGNVDTPLYWPRWGYKTGQAGAPVSFDFDSGHRAKIGYYANIGQQFAVNPDATLGLRFYPTTKEGVGFGLEGEYDFTQTPASPLFLGEGEFRSLYTTQDRGYLELYHRHEVAPDTILRLQAEQWGDEDFYKDFYYEQYRDRTQPRSFAHVTHTQPGYIATGTVRPNTHDFLVETERLPEATYHLLTRELAKNLYVSYDAIYGYLEREPWSTSAVRLANIGRATYDINVHEGLSITPFAELNATYYSEGRSDEESDVLLAETVGATLQTRLHRVYPGFMGFSQFKHVVLPSITLSYRPEPGMGVHETPRFDAYDVVHGRSRLETKLDNIIYGRDAETEEVWPVARLTLYQGNDFWNEIQKAEDYEAEMDLRPRPWWGWLLAAERHTMDEEFDLDEPYWLQKILLDARETITGKGYDETYAQYDPRGGQYDRLLTYVYYEEPAEVSRYNAHVGYAYTETRDEVFNREVLYGGGLRLGKAWGIGFEHRYDFAMDELTRQTYEIRRNLHCWEAAIQFRDRQEGWDIGISFNVVAFPGTRLKY